jgi:hypothetical protein
MGTGHYVLGVETGRGGSNGLAAPVLPGPCRAGAVATPIAGARMLRYPFVCARPLAAQDTLVLPWRREGALVQVRWADGREVTRYFGARSGEIEVPLRRLEVASQDWRAVARRFLALGVWHILAGADHLLFVLGLLMIVRGVGPLVKTITAFTLAHSLTLAATALGFAAVPVRAVESAIALSIVFLAAEILRSMRGAHGLAHRAPWVVAFAFGLLHGFGFAGALAEAGAAAPDLPLALAAFNVGVELGQILFVLAVLALAPALAALRARVPAWTAPAPAYALGAVATWWLVERSAWLLAGA